MFLFGTPPPPPPLFAVTLDYKLFLCEWKSCGQREQAAAKKDLRAREVIVPRG